MKIMERHTSIVSYLASAFAGLTVNEWVGIILGVATFLVNLIFQVRRDRREQRRAREA